MPFEFSLFDGGTPRWYSNEELLTLASPNDPTLPYVYADFEWAHCADEGVDFASLLPTT